MPEGRRPEGTVLPEGFFLPRTKNNRGRGGYIVVFSPTRPHIYNKYTTFSVSPHPIFLRIFCPTRHHIYNKCTTSIQIISMTDFSALVDKWYENGFSKSKSAVRFPMGAVLSKKKGTGQDLENYARHGGQNFRGRKYI